MNWGDNTPLLVSVLVTAGIAVTSLAIIELRRRKDPVWKLERYASRAWVSCGGSDHCRRVIHLVGRKAFLDVVGSSEKRWKFVASSLFRDFTPYLRTAGDLGGALRLFHQWDNPYSLLPYKADTGFFQTYSFQEWSEAVLLFGEDGSLFSKKILPKAFQIGGRGLRLRSPDFKEVLDRAIQIVADEREQHFKESIVRLEAHLATGAHPIEVQGCLADNGLAPAYSIELADDPAFAMLDETRTALDELPNQIRRIRVVVREQWVAIPSESN